MRESFRHYFKPTKETLSDAWRECLFSFDSSVLLNVYGYSNETREKLISFTELNDTRVRLPHQFGLEYSRNRLKVIVRQINKYSKVEEALQKIKETEIVPKRDHPYLTRKSLKAFEAIQKELADSRKTILKWIGADPCAERIFEAFENRMSPCPTEEQLSELHRKANERYQQKIPPGFADLKEKDTPEAYGDYIGWCQLMQIAKVEQKPIIFVTDDFKEDWWDIESGRPIRPRPDLLEEFTRETGQEVHIYSSENFLRAAREFMSADIRDEVIEEVRERLEGQRESQRAVDLKPPAAGVRIEQDEEVFGAPSDVKMSESKSISPGPQDKPNVKSE